MTLQLLMLLPQVEYKHQELLLLHQARQQATELQVALHTVVAINGE
jgi:hypothetical protein